MSSNLSYDFFSRVRGLNRRRRNCGASRAVVPTTSKVTIPPAATQGTVPIHAATIPLSKAPISFDEQINIQLTPAILPRISSGDKSRTMDRRMTILTPSKTPLKVSAVMDSQKFFEKAKMSMLMPKPVTVSNKFRPARAMGGWRVATSIMSKAPAEGAAFNNPKPLAPTCKMSLANIGKSAMAPPKSTAKRSSAMAPSKG